ncbi:uncharacterized protein BO97DRAFT_421055 [Aspergillus homomorphus CBS 101889]|uniref:Uncharacterized protein n=1 Tax=Aspergillus homomorphus (strain CBS 101889) TaxID=1450537 RepID=A0A395I997_ASPHC|nr:hypothetical protein BO97DRAFT_421055 [Aspergillus homomorphus CBS 101889]RAL15803.1 hypothetical protein BO97DRAFT_421055 [Aspergillus homomorphus CBS 101889]
MPPWRITNTPASLPSPDKLASSFSLRAPPSTDLWDSPPDTCVFTAPILYQILTLVAFGRARVTITADLDEPFAQGGLALVIPQSDGSRKWVKTGMEFMEGRQILSTVGKDRWPDCSAGGVITQEGAYKTVTLEIARRGQNLEVIQLRGGDSGALEREILRELVWVFAAQGVEECWVGVYVANPSSEAEAFDVRFDGLVIEHLGKE